MWKMYRSNGKMLYVICSETPATIQNERKILNWGIYAKSTYIFKVSTINNYSFSMSCSIIKSEWYILNRIQHIQCFPVASIIIAFQSLWSGSLTKFFQDLISRISFRRSEQDITRNSYRKRYRYSRWKHDDFIYPTTLARAIATD